MSGLMQFNGVLTTGGIICKNVQTEDAVVTNSLTVDTTNILNLLDINGYQIKDSGTSLKIMKDGETYLQIDKDE